MGQDQLPPLRVRRATRRDPRVGRGQQATAPVGLGVPAIGQVELDLQRVVIHLDLLGERISVVYSHQVQSGDRAVVSAAVQSTLGRRSAAEWISPRAL